MSACRPFMLFVPAALLVACPRPTSPPPATAAPTPGPHPVVGTGPALDFCVQEGASENCLLAADGVSAHVVATSGPRGRLVVAFPAGNSGAALWLTAPDAAPVALRISRPPRPVRRGRITGVALQIESLTPLRVERTVLGSIRAIRDYHNLRSLAHRERIVTAAADALSRLPSPERREAEALGYTPASLAHRARTHLETRQAGRPTRLVARAQSLDGKHTLELSVELAGGVWDPGSRTLDARETPFTLEVSVLGSYPTLPTVRGARLLRPEARASLERLGLGPGSKTLRSLEFLATERKLLAGSWRFLTYFGRDTLMTVWMLLPVLRPDVVEVGLQSVLERLSPEGRVAHEESIGDQAGIERLERFVAQIDAGRHAAAVAELRRLGEPVFDYKMIDDDFMLPCVLAAYLEEQAVSTARVRRFLGRAGNLGAVARNLDFVVRRAAKDELVGLQPGLPVGDWRDSNEGLGGGRFPASVNLYLVPAALEAMRRLWREPKLDRRALLATARKERLQALLDPNLERTLVRLHQRWRRRLKDYLIALSVDLEPRLRRFLQHVSPLERRLLRAREIADGVTLGQLLDEGRRPASLGGGYSVEALSLNEKRQPVEVMHSDDGFALLGMDLGPTELAQRLTKYELAYPAGLYDPLGVFVANPSISRRSEDYLTFDRGHYHGTVVWSWQLGLLQLGLARQYRRLQRDAAALQLGLPRRLRRLLLRLGEIPRRVGALRDTELWAVTPTARGFEAKAYGHGAGQTTESNVAQLWSAVHLAVAHTYTRLGLTPRPE